MCLGSSPFDGRVRGCDRRANWKAFPTDDEINLVLTQTERAIQQYKPLIDQEEIQMGKSATDAVAMTEKM